MFCLVEFKGKWGTWSVVYRITTDSWKLNFSVTRRSSEKLKLSCQNSKQNNKWTRQQEREWRQLRSDILSSWCLMSERHVRQCQRVFRYFERDNTSMWSVKADCLVSSVKADHKISNCKLWCSALFLFIIQLSCTKSEFSWKFSQLLCNIIASYALL